MSNQGVKALTILFVGSLSWYAGIKFWQPIVIEQLKKDGNLRDDIDIPEPPKQPQSWQDLRDGVKATLHPDLAAKEDTKLQRDLKDLQQELKNDRDKKL